MDIPAMVERITNDIIAVIVIVGTVYMIATNKDVPSWFVAIDGTVIGYYFSQKGKTE